MLPFSIREISVTPTIHLMRQHCSIRKFTSQAITPQQLAAIIDAAQSASTSSYLQCVSIIHVTDPALRDKLVQYTSNQSYVASAAEFLVFCIDYHRHQQIVADARLGYTEQVLTGAVDAGLMGQNALLAAESIGLGGVFIGAIRNHPAEVCELLKLPEQVFPLFGLCLGWPDQTPDLRPRLPVSMVLHDNQYQFNDSHLSDYNQRVSTYYAKRAGGGNKNLTWTDHVTAKLSKESRPFMLAALHKQKLSVK